MNILIINFDSGKSEVPPVRLAALQKGAGYIKKLPTNVVLEVGGHTDNVGSYTFNLDLSQRRAAAVVDALASRYRVARERMTPIGVSFASPVASNRDETGRAKNRRVALVAAN